MKRTRAVPCLALFAMALLASPASAQRFQILWQAGQDDGGWPDADFVQEDGQQNDPPGNPNARDDDWYFPGTYPDPIGDLPGGSPLTGALERAFVPTDPDIRLHFNLPAELAPQALMRFTTEPLNLDQRGEIPDPRYQFTVTFNGNEILPPTVITPDDLGVAVTTDPFTANQVDAVGGPGFDNVIQLSGQNLENGGNWMGFDYHRLEVARADGVPALSEIGLLILTLVIIQIGAWILYRKRRLKPASA